jgi:hypothetical protein
MARLKQIAGVVLSLALLAGTLYGFWRLLTGVAGVFRSLDSTVAVSVISASAAILVSTITVVLGKARDARLTIEKEVRDRKIPVYEELISFMFRVLMGSKTGNAPSEQEVMEFFAKFTPHITVWGADGVVKAWVEFRSYTVDTDRVDQDPFRGILLYEAVLRAIRRDLGHRNAGLKAADLLGLFINDAHAQMAQRGK